MTTQVHDKAKQGYLFWGLLPVNNSSANVPVHGDYQVKTCFNVEDALLSLISCGIISYRTIKVLEYRQDKIEGVDFEVGDKVIAKKNRKKILGEIVGIDAKQKKISYLHLNIYGEQKVKSSKFTMLNGFIMKNKT